MQLDVQRLKEALEGTGWMRFLSVMSFLTVAYYAFSCVVQCFSKSPSAILDLILAVLMAIFGWKLWSAANNLDRLRYKEDPEALYAAFNDLGTYFLIFAISPIVGLIVGLLVAIASIPS
ncbi:MAG: DUF5362 domain-containing protein [Thermotogae bacterium]|nr:DUF5362 domain-containing protein [Thermotogota bacterium]